MNMVIQGSNNPLVIQFDKQVDNLPQLVITLWYDRSSTMSKMIKKWEKDDMMVTGDTAVCSIDEIETSKLPAPALVLEAKGLDAYGNTIFWDEYKLDVKQRRDKIIMLSGGD